MAYGLQLVRGPVGDRLVTSLVIDVYLFMWVTFSVIYLVWTHASYARRSPAQLVVSSRLERRGGRRTLARMLGSTGASGWTLIGAVFAVAITILIAQSPEHRSQPLYIALGLITVACSWTLMVYAFALEYMQLALGTPDEETHVDMRAGDAPQFGDFLTLAVLVSAMGSTESADIRTRRAWTLVRTNVVLGFAFNSVIVAMMVSLLFSGLGG